MDFFSNVKPPKLMTLLISILLNIILLISTLLLIYKYINKKCECPNNDLITCNNETSENNLNEETLKNEEKTNYHVEIKGAVKNPGVYEVSDANIINDVVKMAGGFNKDAYSDNINLSRHLSDELVIFVYTKNEYKKDKSLSKEETTCNCPTYDITDCKDSFSSVITSSEKENNDIKDNLDNNLEASNNNSSNKDATNTTTNENESKLVNINTASVSELMTLSGIGESKALDIIKYRETNGLFKSIDDIKKVNGIKDATFNKIKDYITV